MKKRVAVWGTGNVGRPAIRAVLAHKGLELCAVIVSNPNKVGKDAGEIAGVEPAGVLATDDWQGLIAGKVAGEIDALVYAASADTRAEEAFVEMLSCIGAGINVVSPAFYPLLYPQSQNTVKEAVDATQAVCEQGKASVFVSGVDPGWAMDILPIMLSGVVSDIQEIRMQEIFNYALYDAPDVVRDVIGFGQPMENKPSMLEESALKTVWSPMVEMVAKELGYELDSIDVVVAKRALENDVSVATMGEFKKGTQGAFRFEVHGVSNGHAGIVLEHITRIHSDCAPDWPRPAEGEGCHQVIIKGNPELVVSLHGHDPVEPGPAGGGNCTAANRLVNAIPAVCNAAPGIVSAIDLPAIHGGMQMRG